MAAERAVTAAWGVVEVEGEVRLLPRPVIELSSDGDIERIRTTNDAEPAGPGECLLTDLGRTLLLPGFVNAHSHAFQRLIRGRTGGGTPGDPSSFWSWREAMYGMANTLDADGVYEATRACFAEMLGVGITCVGEFHYLHHGPGGTPYENRNELSLRVIQAAREVGIRLCLLEVFYARDGVGRAMRPEQRRFCDTGLDAYLERVDALLGLSGGRRGALAPDGFSLGIAPHSVRAVEAEQLAALAAYAGANELVLHAHVSEQPRENAECRDEHGKTPMQLLADAGCLNRPRNFTAVHAVHVETHDVDLLREQHVCACPTTEADLGDGVVPASAHHRAGVRFALGSDSNGVIDLVQEARLLEMNERLRRQSRLCLPDHEGRVAPTLLRAATEGGASSLGLGPLQGKGLGRLATGAPFDAVAIDLQHPSLVDVPETHVLDALMLAGSAAPVCGVWVGGRRRI